MIGISLLFIFILMPLMGIPFYLFFYFFDKNKRGVLYSLLLGTTIGIISYHFIPKVGYDLLRHHQIVYYLTGKSIGEVFRLSNLLDLEVIPILYSYLISFTNNINLLQFFVVSIGYSIILFMLYDYRKRSKTDNITFLAIMVYVLFSFQHLYFFSGLYCYIAIIIFSLAVYMEYVIGMKKQICFVLYILSLLIHTSIVLPFLILIIYKLFGNKLNIKSILITVSIFLSTYIILNVLNNLINNSITNTMLTMYNSYILNDEHLKIYYSGILLYLELSKIIVVGLCIYFDKKDKLKSINGYIILLTIMIVMMMTRSRVAIRYLMVVQILGMVPLTNSFLNSSKIKRLLLFVIILVFGIAYVIYYYNIFSNQNFGNLSDNIINNIFNILLGGKA